MRQFKAGFALVEMLISIMISSLISTVLFALVIQAQKSANQVDKNVFLGITLMSSYERLAKDFAGMVWPQFLPQTVVASAPATNSMPANQESKKEPDLTIAKVVYSENNQLEGQTVLKECSFITSNPMQIYNQITPKIVRVIYSLEPEDFNPNSFTLYRQESLNLNYQDAKAQALKYALINGVRSLSVFYFYSKPEDNQEQVKNSDQYSDDVLANLNQYLELNLDYSAKTKQAEDQNLTSAQQPQQALIGLVPNYIKINLTLWLNPNQNDFKDFEFWFVTYHTALKSTLSDQKPKDIMPDPKPKAEVKS